MPVGDSPLSQTKLFAAGFASAEQFKVTVSPSTTGLGGVWISTLLGESRKHKNGVIETSIKRVAKKWGFKTN